MSYFKMAVTLDWKGGNKQELCIAKSRPRNIKPCVSMIHIDLLVHFSVSLLEQSLSSEYAFPGGGCTDTVIAHMATVKVIRKFFSVIILLGMKMCTMYCSVNK